MSKLIIIIMIFRPFFRAKLLASSKILTKKKMKMTKIRKKSYNQRKLIFILNQFKMVKKKILLSQLLTTKLKTATKKKTMMNMITITTRAMTQKMMKKITNNFMLLLNPSLEDLLKFKRKFPKVQLMLNMNGS